MKTAEEILIEEIRNSIPSDVSDQTIRHVEGFKPALRAIEAYHNQFSTPKSEQEINKLTGFFGKNLFTDQEVEDIILMKLHGHTTEQWRSELVNRYPYMELPHLVRLAAEAYVRKAAHLSPDSHTWIKVEDGLPPLTEPLMGYDDEGNRIVIIENHCATVLGFNETVGVFKARLTNSGWAEIATNSVNATIKPTHYRALPAPPKEKQI